MMDERQKWVDLCVVSCSAARKSGHFSSFLFKVDLIFSSQKENNNLLFIRGNFFP